MIRIARVLCLAAVFAGAALPPAAAQEPAWQRHPSGHGHDGAPHAAGIGAALKAGDYRFTLRHDGVLRMYRVYVPAGYDPAVPAPLLFALHGGGGNMDLQADDSRYGLPGMAEKTGAIVVFPNGFSPFPRGRLATWNAGDCCGRARDEQSDDVGFIRAVLSQVTRQWTVDRRRVYAAGMSNGAMMAYRLACEMPEVFRAIAAVAGSDTTRQCSPARPVAILHIHAQDDSHVQFGGGAGPDSVKLSAVTDYRAVPDVIAKWTRQNGCTGPAQRVLEKPGAYCEAYSTCAHGAQVQLCVTESGGHSWPGGSKPHGSAPSQAISANDVMWAFFSRL